MNQNKYYHKLIFRCLSYYGKECECCKENIREYLTIYDTQELDAKESRRQLLHRAVKVKDRTRYKVLCLNCVKGYRENGICYHKEKSTTPSP